MGKPKKINQKQLVRLYQDAYKSDSTRFCFVLGAGASVSSGIPSGGTLAKQWYKQIEKDSSEKEFNQWRKKNKIDPNDAGSFYQEIYRQRFTTSPSIGHEFLQNIMSNKEPSIGYLVLSQVLEKTKHNFVITTNFDYLLEDALYLTSEIKPLVCGHESLASYVRAFSDRPTIIKVHRDLMLEPFNTDKDCETLAAAWVNALKPIIHDFNLLVLGYGGNDGSLMNYLIKIGSQYRKSIYWCYRKGHNLSNKVVKLLTENDYLIEIEDFDQLMYALNEVSDFRDEIKNIATNEEDNILLNAARSKIVAYKKKLDELAQQLNENKEKLSTEKESSLKSILPNWWELDNEINKIENEDEKDQAYRKALQQLPKSVPLMNVYATFLERIRKDYNAAESYYKKALELNYDSSANNYALFLEGIRKDYDAAESYYKKTLELNPDNDVASSNYAHFLDSIRKDYDAAESYHKKALELNPDNGFANSGYARFLAGIRKDYDAAESYHKKALELNPDSSNNNNYALFLEEIHKDYDEAESYYKKALELNPSNAVANNNYANLLNHRRQDYENAESYYKESLELNPDNEVANSNYAIFLMSVRRDYDAAEGYYKKSLELEPNKSIVNCSYANFLRRIRKDYDNAESYYKKALGLKPDSGYVKNGYANYLKDVHKDYNAAEKYYKKALGLEPDSAGINGNYAGLLLSQRKKKSGHNYLDKAFKLLGSNSLGYEVVLLHLWFLTFVYKPVKAKQARKEINLLLDQGFLLVGAELSLHIENAKKDGCKYLDELKELAEKITTVPKK